MIEPLKITKEHSNEDIISYLSDNTSKLSQDCDNVKIVINITLEDDISLGYIHVYNHSYKVSTISLDIVVNNIDTIMSIVDSEYIKSNCLLVEEFYIYNIAGYDYDINKMINKFINLKKLRLSCGNDEKKGYFNNFKIDDTLRFPKLSILDTHYINYLPNNVNDVFPSLDKLFINCYSNDEIEYLNTELCISQLNILGFFFMEPNIKDKICLDIKNILKIENLEVYAYPDVLIKTESLATKNIKILEIHNCTIDNLMDFNKIKTLEALELTDVFVNGKMDNLSLDLPSLLHLKLVGDYNAEHIDKLILILPSVININIRFKLKEVPVFIGCHKLETLLMSGNDIMVLPDDMFKNLTNLTHLQCNNNKLKKIGQCINSCKYLYELYIMRNELKLLPSKMEYVQFLYCDHNPLITIDNVLFRQLQFCTLYDTDITRLSLNKRNKLPLLTRIECFKSKLKYISPELRDYIKER